MKHDSIWQPSAQGRAARRWVAFARNPINRHGVVQHCHTLWNALGVRFVVATPPSGVVLGIQADVPADDS